MRVVFMGPPGAGKGTQAELLAKTFGIVHISTGDMFRMAVREGTPMGLIAKSYMDRGALVPDEVTIGIVKDRLARPDTVKGFILDGFPRTTAQADALQQILAELGTPLDSVVNIDVPHEKLVRRASGRRVCKCGASYHVEYSPPKVADVCDKCGCELVQRRDDHVEVVSQRLVTYEAQTRPLIEYYQKKGLLKQVAGDEDVALVFANIVALLERPA
jgi:adenylate kinase